MKSEQVLFNKALLKKYDNELHRRIYFISSDILDFQLIIQDDVITGLEVTITDDTNFKLLSEKINNMVEKEISPLKLLSQKVIWRSTHKACTEKDLFDRLVDKGWAYVMAEGQVCFGEQVIRLMDSLDMKIKNIAVKQLGAREYMYPTLIPTKTLEDCGYFDSFPHMLMLVTRLHSDVEVYEAFAKEYQEKNKLGPFALSYCNNTDYCLPPTMCYHTYHQLRNSKFNENENRVITTKGKSFRYESKYHHTLERLWDFTIREIVFMGDKDFVLNSRQKFMEASFELIEKLGLAGHCEVANDPFFCNSDTVAKIFNQRMLKLKYELQLPIDEDKTIAVGSFNYHEQFFGENFNIQNSDADWINTGCVGFGLERLVYTFMCQHGLDEMKWSDILEEDI